MTRIFNNDFSKKVLHGTFLLSGIFYYLALVTSGIIIFLYSVGEKPV